MTTDLMLYQATITKLENWLEDVWDCDHRLPYNPENDVKAINSELELRRVWSE